MKCPQCSCEMEEYQVESLKIIYNNGQDTSIRMERDLFVCPNCGTIMGKVQH